jgi:K+-sensing histidine kinase KdpD
VYVEPTQGERGPQTVEEERQLRKNLQLGDELGATVVRLRGKVDARRRRPRHRRAGPGPP